MRTALGVVLLVTSSLAAAQERIADFQNSVRLEYQYISTGTLDTGVGPLDIGETDTHVGLLSGVFSLGKRWKMFGSIPYVQKRHTGALPHDFTEFAEYTPPDLRLIDDGHFHGGLQDLYGGVQYLAVEGQFSVSPHISYGIPGSDYPFYGNAAIGKNLREIPIGVFLEFTPYFSDWYFQADVSYVFTESVLGVDLDYWLAYLSASFYVTPRFAPRVFVTSRRAPNALRFPEDFTDDFSPDDFDNEFYYRHDQTLKHEFINAGIGFDYIVSDHYEISATYYRTIDPTYVAEIDYAFTFALTRRF